MFDNGQSQTRAADRTAAAGIDPVKPFKDPRQVFRRDARALVPDPDNYLGAFPLGFHLDHPPRLAEFDGIVHQIHQGLFQQGRVDLGPEVFGAIQL